MKKIRRAWYCPKCKSINLIKSDGTFPLPCQCLGAYKRYLDGEMRAMVKVQKSWVPLWEIKE